LWIGGVYSVLRVIAGSVLHQILYELNDELGPPFKYRGSGK
jgi:hypothetical protein